MKINFLYQSNDRSNSKIYDTELDVVNHKGLDQILEMIADDQCCVFAGIFGEEEIVDKKEFGKAEPTGFTGSVSNTTFTLPSGFSINV